MTTYSIVKAINNSVNNAFLGQERYYVVFADGERSGTRENIVGYATDESAKRRIRDLKRKEAETVKPIASPHADNVAKLAASSEYGKTHHPNGNVSMPIKKAPFDWDGKLTADEKAMIAPAGSGSTGLLTINKHGDVVQNPAIAPDTLDDDMRKFVAENVTHHPVDFIANEMTRHGPYAFTETVTAMPINRQVGVYPAIPKRAYQR